MNVHADEPCKCKNRRFKVLQVIKDDDVVLIQCQSCGDFFFSDNLFIENQFKICSMGKDQVAKTF